MKVSVIIPAHNEELWIAQTLQAILNQDYPDFEVIVVDNASTDATAQISSKFRVKVVAEHRKGTQWARERGRTEASGEIIVTMDADCRPNKNWLTTGVSFFSHPRVVAVSGPYNYYDASGFFRIISLGFQKIFYVWTNRFMQLFGTGAVLIGGNAFHRASALQKIGGFNTAILFYGDDTDTAKRIATVGRVVFSNQLVQNSSARRFEKEGTPRTFFHYIFNFFKVIFSGL